MACRLAHGLAGLESLASSATGAKVLGAAQPIRIDEGFMVSGVGGWQSSRCRVALGRKTEMIRRC